MKPAQIAKIRGLALVEDLFTSVRCSVAFRVIMDGHTIGYVGRLRDSKEWAWDAYTVEQGYPWANGTTKTRKAAICALLLLPSTHKNNS